jgi:hypothetical protein
LPSSASRYQPSASSSINTLANFEDFMEEGEYDCALYALAGIAWGVNASEGCWSALDAAARLMGFDEQRRKRAFLAGIETPQGDSDGSQGGPVTPPQ